MSELIPDGWNNIAIDDFIERVIDNRGKTPPLSDTGYGLIEIGALSESGRFPDYSRIRKRVDANTFDTWFRAGHPKKGDILIPTVGTIGICCILDKTLGSIAQNLIALRVKPENNPVYAYYILSSYWTTKQIEMIVMNAVQPSLRVPQFLELKALQPPLPEQQKIAAILSSVDEVIEKTQAQINKLKDLKTGMMQELLSPREGQVANINNPQGESKNGLHHTEFKDSPLGRIPVDWEALPLNAVCRIQGGYAFQSKDSTENGCRWLKIANVGKGEVKWDTNSFLPNNFKALHDAFMLSAGDIVVALTRPVLSGELKTAKLTSQDVPALLNQRVARAIPNTEKVTNDFLYNLFSWKKLAEDIETTIFGTDPPNVSTTQIGSFVFPVPPISQQIKISQSINSVIAREQLILTKYNALQHLKKALMQDLLTGKVRVKVD